MKTKYFEIENTNNIVIWFKNTKLFELNPHNSVIFTKYKIKLSSKEKKDLLQFIYNINNDEEIIYEESLLINDYFDGLFCCVFNISYALLNNGNYDNFLYRKKIKDTYIVYNDYFQFYDQKKISFEKMKFGKREINDLLIFEENNYKINGEYSPLYTILVNKLK